jgi:hypothetical protein
MTQSATLPPLEWQNEVGRALYEAGEADRRKLALAATNGLWADARLACLPGSDAVVPYLKAMQERCDALDASLIADGVLGQEGLWRRAYEHEWSKLVHGECDFEGPDDPLHTIWLEHQRLDPKDAARQDFEAVFTLEQRKRYRSLSHRLPWEALKA